MIMKRDQIYIVFKLVLLLIMSQDYWTIRNWFIYFVHSFEQIGSQKPHGYLTFLKLFEYFQ